MAGYIFAIGSKNKQAFEALQYCVINGVYSTRCPRNPRRTSTAFEGTLADYVTMKEGDNVYFFLDRKIYGIGEMVKIGNDCKYCNYPESCKLEDYSLDAIHSKLLVDFGVDSVNNRWICTFKPQPYFFKRGVDMDDVLSYKPDSIKTLRAFWKLSFIKIDDNENQSLKEIILLRNQEELLSPSGKTFPYEHDMHDRLRHKINDDYLLEMKSLLSSCNNGNLIKHEKAIEAATLFRLSNDNDTVFGKWDYLSHQVIASPFKPVDYMDKMDIFGYRFLDNTQVVSKYLIIEIKKDAADIRALHQIAKYVDWVCKEYAYGDYSMIEAYILASSFSANAIKEKEKICLRNYAFGNRPIENRYWKDLRLITYSFNGTGLVYTEQL